MRGGHGRRAKFILLSAVGITLLGQFGMNIALETTAPGLRDPEYGCRLDRIRHLVDAHPATPLVIALGSSRTQLGMSPCAMPPLSDAANEKVLLFNFGLSGCGPLLELLTLHRLLDAGIQPDYLLVEVLPPALHQDGDGAQFLTTSRLGWNDLGVLAPFCQDPTQLYLDWGQLRLSPWSTIRFCLVSKLIPGWLTATARVDYLWETVDSFGWIPYPLPEVTSEQRNKGYQHAHTQYSPHLTNFHISPIPDQSLRQIIDLCDHHSIPVAFYLMPESERFRSWYPPETRERIQQYLDELSNTYGVPVFDASTWINEFYFTDGHHLLPHGAALFSERFAREAITPWLGAQ